MVELGPPFLPTYQGVPPHVSSEDFLLWEQFRKLYGSRYQRFWFDVALGEGAPAGADVPENMRAAWLRLTRFRVDAIGDTGAAWHLLEFRPNAGPGALGAVQVYSTLLAPDVPRDREFKSLVVTDRCAPDIKRVAALVGVDVLCLSEGPA